jgi:sigma-B regulation protein RsbU (phosphoserine phosphatase)
MALGKGGLLNQISINATPSAVMYAMNNLICSAGSRKNLMTFAYGVVDSQTLTLELSNAGHPPPYLYRAATGTVEALESSAYPLGVRRNCEFPVLHRTLEPGDAIVFYSDGIIEAQNATGAMFGYERLEQAILENGTCRAEELRDAILDDSRSFLEVTRTFSGNSTRLIEDDITLVVLKAKG